jgi:GNAT superfamily N-acetyltransferase
MNLNIRKANLNDSKGIIKLIIELAEFEKEPDAVEINATDIENHGFGSNPLFECFVAEINHSIVGLALFYPRYSTWKGPTLHLEDLIVTQSMKGKGIGALLLSSFINHAKDLGVKRIEWAVLEWNTNAINFYEKNGAKVFNDWNIVQMDFKGITKYIANNIKNESF